MNRIATFSLSADNRKELYERLGEVWALGQNVIVGWRLAGGGLEIFYLPAIELPRAAKRHKGLFDRERHVQNEDRHSDLKNAGCRLVVVPISFEPHLSHDFAEQMGAIVRYYTVTHTLSRAVALFDIVQFSRQSPFVGISQINLLSYHANMAAAEVGKIGLPVDLTMSSTGDGFYMWNRNEGMAADLALFYVTGLVVAYNQHAQNAEPFSALPVLRCCFGFGEHYEYYQASGSKPDSRGFIVGDVTIGLDRLISSALPKQFLVSSRIRPNDAPEGDADQLEDAPRVDMPMFFNFAQNNAQLLTNSAIGDTSVTSVSVCLTGDALSARDHTIKKYQVVDKHGFEHRCFNANFDVRTASGQEIRCGLSGGELAEFSGVHLGKEDIRVKRL